MLVVENREKLTKLKELLSIFLSLYFFIIMTVHNLIEVIEKLTLFTIYSQKNERTGKNANPGVY